MRIATLCAVLLAVSVGAETAELTPDVSFGPSAPSYKLSVGGGKMTFLSGTTSCRSNGATNALRLTNVQNVTGSDNFGAFAATSGSYAFDGKQTPSIRFSVRTYPARPDVVVFEQEFLEAVSGTSTGDMDAVVSSFPSFAVPEADSQGIGYAHFSGYMAGNYPQYGRWAQNSSGNLAGGMKNSGMITFLSETDGVALVVSPMSNFMAASVYKTTNSSELQWGIMGGASQIPKGFRISWLMVASNGGTNRAVRRWGEVLRAFYNRQESQHDRDLTLRYLGYSTDNGAFYYYYTGKYKNYEQALSAVKSYSTSVGLPYRYVQLDSWWYYRQDGADKSGVPLSGVTNWTSMPTVFPNGMPSLYNTTGWPVMAHNRYWATNNVYASNPQQPIGPTAYRGKTFEFVWGIAAGLPTSYDFWDNLFEINKDWGLTVYEQDWLSLTTNSMPVLQENVTFGRSWLQQMGRAADAHGLSVQYCMSFPRHVFTGLELPAVTQARASNDYQPQSNIVDYDQWRIGESSLWVSALGISPSKDSYWSRNVSQYTPHYDKFFNTTETRNRLESVVSSMANGPVQISDRIGFSDVDLIMRCCSTNGLILRPDTAGSPIDRYFAYRTLGEVAGGGVNGVVHTTYSTIGSTTSAVYLLAAKVATPFKFLVSDLPFEALDAVPAGTRWAYYEANTTDSVRLLTEDAPIPVAVSDELTFQYFTIVPLLQPRGWNLLGEPRKWIGKSHQRFTSVTSEGDSITAVFAGSRGERVLLQFVRGEETPTTTSGVVACSVVLSGLRGRCTLSGSNSTDARCSCQ